MIIYLIDVSLVSSEQKESIISPESLVAKINRKPSPTSPPKSQPSNSRIPSPTHYVSRITHHVSRFTPHASHLTLFLFLFAVYLLTYTPRINSSDGLAMFSTAESLIRRGALDIEQIRWMDLQQGTYGLDGLLYSRKGVGVPIGLLPLTWLGLIVPWWGTVSVSLLFNAIVTALTAVLLLAYLQQLGFSQRVGIIVALTFGLTTLAWPYAKSLFSDPFSGLLLLGAAYALLKFNRLTNPAPGHRPDERIEKEEPRSREERAFSPAPPFLHFSTLVYPFLAGLLLGWNIAARYAEAIFLPVFGLLLLYYEFKKREDNGTREQSRTVLSFIASPSLASSFRFTQLRSSLPPILAFITPILLTGLALVSFNLSRYGDPFDTGYLPNETFGGILWQGLAGQLVSPGRGLLLYCPIFIMSLVGLPAFLRRFRPEAVLALSIIVIHLLMYGKWFMWHGGYAWGPRFMVPTLPFWSLLLAPIAEQAFSRKREEQATKQENKQFSLTPSPPHLFTPSPLRLLYLTLATLSLIPQLLSVLIDFAPFQNSLLETGLPLFAPQTFFEPHYSPFVGAWAFINSATLDLAWVWQGEFNGWLLAVLVINLVLTGLQLKMRVSELTDQQFSERHGTKWQTAENDSPPHPFIRSLFYLTLISTLSALTLLLAHAHTLPPQPLQQAVTALNEAVRPSDAVIINNPDMTMPFAELYKGRAPVLGLHHGSFPLPADISRRLAETIAGHQQIWWLPTGLPPEESAIEQTLLAEGFRARNEDFAGQRLVLISHPDPLLAETISLKATFAGLITLTEIAYPPYSSPGTTLPVELHWQALASVAEDYHIFIHLLAEDGTLIAQADGQPVLWRRPTSTWAVGEIIVDRYGLWIPPQTASGVYQLAIGLYRPTDGQRLHLSTGADRVQLTTTVQIPK